MLSSVNRQLNQPIDLSEITWPPQTEQHEVPGPLTNILKDVAARAAAILASAVTTKLPLMVMEALLVALYSHRDTLSARTDIELIGAYKNMLTHPSFAEGARYAVSSAPNVKQRLDAAVAAFSPVWTVVETTLRELDTWFKEPETSNDRTKLLSKLAIIELCGWLEVEFDRLIRTVATGRISDADWVEVNVIKNTNGFTYNNHWRAMLCKVVGEVFARRVEAAMEAAHPAELEQFKSLLGQLWKDRCSFAHADITTNVAAAQLFNAPSWTINQHMKLKQILARYETVMISVMPAP
jgi:hypothetical protein